MLVGIETVVKRCEQRMEQMIRLLEHINVTGGTEQTVDGMASGGGLTTEEPFDTMELISSFDKDLGAKKIFVNKL